MYLNLKYRVVLHAILVFQLAFAIVQGQENITDATCDEFMTYCRCPKEVDVCRIELHIEPLLTFTRYKLDTPPGTQGKIYFINETTGELQHLPLPPDRQSCTDTTCTTVNTVDGRTFRSFIGINGRIPGPTLIVHENQTVVADVNNHLETEGTSIHWHGMHQHNTPWMDGIGLISQCPIGPKSSFRYIFRAYPPGSFWYHSHSGAQRTDGLYGGLIVMEGTNASANLGIEFEDLPEQHTMSLLDWQREETIDLFAKVHSKIRYFPDSNSLIDEIPTSENDFYTPTLGPDGSAIGIIKYWSGLINGLGKHPDVPFSKSRLSIFEVSEGKSYRFRAIGAQSVYAYNISIDNHKLTVIATDGYFIQPVEVDFVIVHTGERYDFIISAVQTEQPDYWIRARTLEFNSPEPRSGPPSIPPPYESLEHEALAILHYSGAPPPTSLDYSNITNISRGCSADNPCTAVNCPFEKFHESYHIDCINVHELRLLNPTPDSELPSIDADVEYIFNFAFENPQRTSTINGRNFIFPSAALQTQQDELNRDRKTFECNLEDDCNEGCHCLHIHDIPYKKTARLVVSTKGNSLLRRRFTHPVHLHGHSFHVVAIGYGDYDDNGLLSATTNDLECGSGSTAAFCVKPQWRNVSELNFTIDEYTVRKDTVILPAGGYVVIHFISDNPGFWFLHCHIEPHQLEGMALVINEAQEQQNPPPNGMRTCGNFTWSLDTFNKKLQFNPDEQASGLSLETIVGIAVGGFLIICIVVVLLVMIWICVSGKKKTIFCGQKSYQTFADD